MTLRTQTLLLLAPALLFASALFAQPCAAPTASADLEANRIRARIGAGGNLFNDGVDGAFIPLDPPGSNNPTTVYTASLWMAGVDPAGNLKITAPDYGPGLWTGPLSPDGTTTAGDCANWDRVFLVDGQSIQNMLSQLPNLTPSELRIQFSDVAGWPAKGNPFFTSIHGFDLPQTPQALAPFYDANGDNQYNPLDGDYPAVVLQGKAPFVPAQIAWTVFNDVGAGNNGVPQGTAFLGMEIQLTAWGFDCAASPVLNNTVFTSHKLIYRGFDPIDSLQIGIFTDFDLGCYLDDYQGCSPERNAFYTYNQDPVDGNVGGSCNGFPSFPGEVPVQSATFLNKKLDRFMYFESGSVGVNPIGMHDPTLPIEYFRYLTGHWRDGSPLTEGGSGYQGAGAPATHAFPDNPISSSGWTMCTAGLALGDRRVLGVHQIGKLFPGAVNELTMAWTHHPDSDLPCGLANTYDEIDLVQGLFDSGFDGVCSPVAALEPSLDGRITLSPNPATDAVTVRYGDVAVQHIHLFDPTGRLVQSMTNVPSDNVTLNLSGLPAGLYHMQFVTTVGSWVEKLVKQ